MLARAPIRIRFTVNPTFKFVDAKERRVEAIKDLRYLTSLSLKDSKDIVDAMTVGHNAALRPVKVEITNPEAITHFLASRLEDILSERHGTDPKVLRGDWIYIDGMVVENIPQDTTFRIA